jgi:hypothetical protein
MKFSERTANEIFIKFDIAGRKCRQQTEPGIPTYSAVAIGKCLADHIAVHESVYGPMRQILRRKRMSAFRVIAEVAKASSKGRR